MRTHQLQQEFLDRLCSLAEERGERPDTWMDYEEEQMLLLVNAHRAEAGLPDIARQVVAAANTAASGHSDYGPKFSLYCAEIAKDSGPFLRYSIDNPEAQRASLTPRR